MVKVSYRDMGTRVSRVAGTFDTIRGTVVDEGLDDLIVRFAEEAI
jgi:hypothetical protein